MSAATSWFIEPDSYGNSTLWAPNPDYPEYPIALLVRVPSNAELFDGIGALLHLVAAAREAASLWDDGGSRAVLAVLDPEPTQAGEVPC